MRQAVGAFKAAPSAGMGLKALAAALLALAQGCAILPGRHNPDFTAGQAQDLKVAQARASELQTQVERLSDRNAELEAKVADLEKKNARLATAGPPATPEMTLKEPGSTAAIPEKRPANAAPGAVVAAPSAGGIAKNAPVPVDNTPRLVQPSFASSEQIFENEAESPEIKLTSVLWGVHLASYKHADDASAGWKKLQRENPDELGLLEPRIEKVTVEGKGEYLRLVGGGFSSREKAEALCGKLAEKGVFCRVANFGGDKLSMLEVGVLR